MSAQAQAERPQQENVPVTMEQFAAKHPMPWKARMAGNGILIVTDTTGVVVELFTMLNFVQMVTHQVTAKQ